MFYIKTYLKEIQKTQSKYPNSFSILQNLCWFRSWQRSLNEKANPLEDECPWITFSAIDFVKKITRNDMKVFEYGTGGSTLFFIKRVKKIISVEHDPIWANKVVEATKKYKYKNWKLHLKEPKLGYYLINKDPSNTDLYISSVEQFNGYSFKEYVSSIDVYPDQYFDIILIDGRARPSCFKHSIPKVSKDGYIIWDNTDRKHYFNAMEKAPNFLEFLDFPGCSPYVNFFTRTSAWKCNKLT